MSADRKPAGKAPAGNERDHTERLLDEALADSFPASDPVEMLEPVRPAEEKGKARGHGEPQRKKPADG